MGKIVKREEIIKTGIAALDLVGRPGETAVYVFYDIEDDRIRQKTARVCKDYGLERTQFSGFVGYLSQCKDKTEEEYKTALLYGSVMASFTVEDFSLRKLSAIIQADIDSRLNDLKKIICN